MNKIKLLVVLDSIVKMIVVAVKSISSIYEFLYDKIETDREKLENESAEEKRTVHIPRVIKWVSCNCALLRYLIRLNYVCLYRGAHLARLPREIGATRAAMSPSLKVHVYKKFYTEDFSEQ